MNVLEELLNNRWIVKSEDKEKYFKIKDECKKYKKFLQEKLGYQLIVNPYLIKLEKLPGKAEPFMGISEFVSTKEYSLLCIILMFLEDKGMEEQFVLSQLTEYIQMNYAMEKLDWTVYSNRKSLVKVIKFCIKNELFKITDGEEEGFAKDLEAEVLYESNGTSRYFVRNFTREIMEYSGVQDFEKSEWIDANEDRGVVRRQRVYRKLIMSMGVYKISNEDEDFIYIKSYRNSIEHDMDEFFNCDLHIHNSNAYLVVREDVKIGRCFPENSNLSDIVLLINEIILENIQKKTVIPDINEMITMEMHEFTRHIKVCMDRYSDYWGKTYRDKTESELSKDVMDYMIGLGLADVDIQENRITLYPIIGKLAGAYLNKTSDNMDKNRGE